MDLVFPLRTRYVSPKAMSCSSPCAPALRGLIQGSRKIPKNVRVRSEFDGKVNGALSADFDPRFLDRVSLHTHYFLCLCSGLLNFGNGFLGFERNCESFLLFSM